MILRVYIKILKIIIILKNRCIEEYKVNKRYKLLIIDGSIVNDFYIEKLKSIQEHIVYFHVVLIKNMMVMI